MGGTFSYSKIEERAKCKAMYGDALMTERLLGESHLHWPHETGFFSCCGSYQTAPLIEKHHTREEAIEKAQLYSEKNFSESLHAYMEALSFSPNFPALFYGETDAPAYVKAKLKKYNLENNFGWNDSALYSHRSHSSGSSEKEIKRNPLHPVASHICGDYKIELTPLTILSHNPKSETLRVGCAIASANACMLPEDSAASVQNKTRVLSAKYSGDKIMVDSTTDTSNEGSRNYSDQSSEVVSTDPPTTSCAASAQYVPKLLFVRVYVDLSAEKSLKLERESDMRIPDAICRVYDPETASICDEIAKLYFQHHDAAQALKWFEKAILFDPRNHVYWYHKGVLYQSLSNKSKAVESFATSLKINNSYAAAHFNLGVVLIDVAPSTAISHFEYLLTENPCDIEVINLIAQCYKKLGQPIVAMQHLRQILEWDPNNFQVNRALRELEAANS